MTNPADLECTQCGICCKVFGDSISPTTENVYSWIINGRTDILNIKPESIEELTPIYVGGKKEIRLIEQYMNEA